MAAWYSGLRFAMKHGFARQSRLFCLLDSAVVTNVIKRGRSSSHQLNPVMRRAVAHQLLHRFEVSAMWIPTKSNPADDGTRDAHLRRARVMWHSHSQKESA
eukprot:676684-Amphidinium_carterae.1